MTEEGFGIVCVEVKNDHFESGVLEEGLTLASEPVTEFFKFSFHEFVSRFSESELQSSDSTESSFRLVQPGIGFVFVAKYLLGLVLHQLNITHFQIPLRPIDDGWGQSVLVLFCATSRVYPRVTHWLSFVNIMSIAMRRSLRVTAFERGF